MKRSCFGFLPLLFLSATSIAWAVDKYWIASGPGNFNVATPLIVSGTLRYAGATQNTPGGINRKAAGIGFQSM